MHVHQSFNVLGTKKNAFVDANDDFGLSEIAKQFIAGQLYHAPRNDDSSSTRWENPTSGSFLATRRRSIISWAGSTDRLLSGCQR